MACKYEEEIFKKYGKVEECGYRQCPYKNLEDCREVNKGLEIDRQDHLHLVA